MARIPDSWWDGLNATMAELDSLALEGERMWPPPGVAAEAFTHSLGADVMDDVALVEALGVADRVYRASHAVKRNLEGRIQHRIGPGGRFPYGVTVYSVDSTYKYMPIDLPRYVEFVGPNWPNTLSGWSVAVTNFKRFAEQRGYDARTAVDTFLQRARSGPPRLQRTPIEKAPAWILNLPEGKVWQPKED